MKMLSAKLVVCCACLALAVLASGHAAFAAPCLESVGSITFIDVGEGDSALIQSGTEAGLVDSGNLISGNEVLALLRRKNIELLNKIILTHPHPDHIGGVFAIAQSIAFSSLHDNGEFLGTQTEDLFRWYTDLIRNNPHYTPLKKGDSFRIGALTVKVLWPSAIHRSKDWNTNSIVLAVRFNKFQAILMGDGNFATETALLNEPFSLGAQILKVGHHGAADVGMPKFLQRVSAKVSIVSVNASNLRGYPAPVTIARLEQSSKVYRTDQSGSITITICKDGSYDLSTAK